MGENQSGGVNKVTLDPSQLGTIPIFDGMTGSHLVQIVGIG